MVALVDTVKIVKMLMSSCETVGQLAVFAPSSVEAAKFSKNAPIPQPKK
jgi:hypothetical protein